MRTDLFDFELPEELIALNPATPRESARLLVVPAMADRRIADLPELLKPGDAIVLNDTRVISAALTGTRTRGSASAQISAVLIRRVDDSRWLALARPAKRLEVGDRIRFGGEGRLCLLGTLDATVTAKGDGGEVDLAFDLAGPFLDEALEAVGEMPLPPYIARRRPPSLQDRRDYQTVWARRPGAVAAPTAGFHLTEALLAAIEAKGVTRHHVTLHVGAGTFLPVKVEDTRAHRMHAEWGEIRPESAAALTEARRRGGRIVAIGTTALRLLESAAAEDGSILPFEGETSIFITPGYRFKAIDALLTNFHLPRSTLFVLVAAFAGLDTMKSAYAHAIRSGYRFYSFGDAGWLERA